MSSYSNMNITQLLDEYKVIVPKIQRDYAQGRVLERENKVRKNLLKNIFEVLIGEQPSGMRLNYIYGIPEGEQLILIDGQQRITTLYLVWMYLAYNAKKPITTAKLLYESRETSKDFCKFIIDNQNILSKDNKSIKTAVLAETSFYRKWLNDPTISGMLQTLEDINNTANTITSEGIFNYDACLCNLEKIQFSFLPLEGFKRGEDLYATMNGRGKQLTSFEIIKPRIIDIAENVYSMQIAEDINEKWGPAFWEYAVYRKENSKTNNISIEEAYDFYLFNYFKYVISMLYAEKNKFEKNALWPTESELLEWLLDKKGNLTEEMEFLLFAMNSFSRFFGNGEKAFNDISNKYDNRHIFIEDFDGNQVIEHCCDAKIKLLEQCVLWAYLKFRFNEEHQKHSNHTLKDYYSLMRDLYAEAWDSNTPISLGKNPPAHLVVEVTIKRFDKIVSGDDITSLQATIFRNRNHIEQLILNNPLTRGRSNNLKKLFDDSYDDEQKLLFSENLRTLFKYGGKETFDMITGLYNKDSFVSYSYPNRIFIPWSNAFFKSLFSMKNWKEEESWYDDVIYKLCEERLKVSPKTYSVCDWQYYLDKHKFMLEGNTYSAFDCERVECGIEFDSKGIYGQKASKRQCRSAFMYSAFMEKHNYDKSSEKLITEYLDYIERYACTISKERNQSGKDEWYFYIDSKPHKWDGIVDFIEFIKSKLV